MTSQTFTIPGRLPGLNELVAAMNSSRYVGNKLKRETDVKVAWCAKAARLTPVTGVVIIDVYWYEPNRRRDPDNIRSAVKFILDALQPCTPKRQHGVGVLQGDGHRHIAGFRDHFGFDSDDPRVVVTLEEL